MQTSPYPNLPPIETVARELGITLRGSGDERRARAIWRDGEGWNIAFNIAKNVWHDHATGESGGVIALVETALGCGHRDAMVWLADRFGTTRSAAPATVRAPADSGWDADLRRAVWWAIAAAAMAEETLEALPANHPERRIMTRLLAALRLGDAALVNEYRDWRQREPELTTAMTEVGRRHEARVQRKLAQWLKGYFDETQES